jgi:hypothetical protein
MKEKNGLENEKFSVTGDFIYQNTGLSRKQKDLALKKLKNLKLIQTENIKLPSKIFYKIDWTRYAEILSAANTENNTMSERDIHDVRKGHCIYNKNINIIKEEDVSKDTLCVSTKTHFLNSKNFDYGDNNKMKILPDNKIKICSQIINKNKSIQKKKKIVPKKLEDNNSIVTWNRLPFTPKHKKKSSKVYQEAVKLLNQIKNGEYRNSEIEAWLQEKNITFDFTVKRKASEIRNWMIELNKLFDPALNPNSKKVPRTLSALIFNKFSTNGFLSWFFIAATTGINYRKPIEDSFPEVTERFADGIFKRELKFNEKQILIKKINEIRKYQETAYDYNIKDNHWNLHPGIWEELSDFDRFAGLYLEFLSNYYTRFKPSLNMIGIHSNNWQRFIDTRVDLWDDWRKVYNFKYK